MGLRRLRTDDRGAVAVIVAILVVAFVALSALVVDVGYMFDTRRQLQAAAEAAALAGCQELIATNDVGAAQAVAAEYANLNAEGGPVDDLVIEAIDVDTTEGSVRVILAQQSPAFFSRLFGPDSNTVRAAAKAQKWVLTGGRYLVPWAIPTIRNVDYVEVALLNGAGSVVSITNLSETGALTYGGSIPAPAATGAYRVRVRIFNDYGVPELLIDSSNNKEAPAGAVVVADAGATIVSVSLSEDYVTPDTDSWPVLTVQTATSQPAVGVQTGKVVRSMVSADGLTWTYQISAADVDITDELLRVYPLDVFVGASADGTVDSYLHVRRSTHPVEYVEAAPAVVGPGGSVSVTVELSDFYPVTAVPGQTYVLRVASPAGEVGNFGELNFFKIVHTSSCPPDPYEPKAGNNYFAWTAYGYEGGVHVSDIIEMSPGSSGVNTQKALDERLSALQEGEDMVVIVPVVEKYEDKGGGSYDVIVETFAAYKIVSYDKSGTVVGEFQQYVANPSTYPENPDGGPNSVYGARLVNP